MSKNRPTDDSKKSTHLKRPHKLLTQPTQTSIDYFALFLQSRQVSEVSPGTLQFYKVKLGRFLAEVNAEAAKRQDIESFLLQFTNPGNRHAYYRAIKAFFNWRELSLGLPGPMKNMTAPRLGKLILPSLTREQVFILLEFTANVRNKAIIAVFTESGLRLTELTNIKPQDIDWNRHTIKVLGKGKKERLAPFGEIAESYVKMWLSQYQPNGNIWGLNQWGITSMLRRLEKATGIVCNPHVFRRTFACLLREAGVDVMTIKDLGGWESLEMVQRYTRSVTFNNSLKFYKPPLS